MARFATLALLPLMVATLALLAACGGREEAGGLTPFPAATAQATQTPPASPSPAPTPTAALEYDYWPRAEEVIRRLVPEAARLELGLFALTDIDRPGVDFLVWPLFPQEGKARLHIILGTNAGAQPLGTSYRDFPLYTVQAIAWTKLVEGQPPLWVGSPSAEALKAYLDFYLSGEPVLANERFWNAFAYVEGRIGAALDGDISSLRIDFDDDWNPKGHAAGGISFWASSPERRAYVGILYSKGDASLDLANLAATLGTDFGQRFALPDVPTEESRAQEWGYANHIWYAVW